MTEKINAALIGLTAPHSKGWLQTLQHCDLIDRLVVCDPESAGMELPGEVVRAYASVEDLLAQEELHFGVISVRNDEAPQVGEQLFRAGIPAIIEKPAARTAAEIARLNELAAANQVMWATGFMNRYAPIAQEFRRVVAGGGLGQIVSIEGRMVTSSVQQRDPDHWLFDKKQAGGGILHWLAIHTIDLIRYLSGLDYRSVMGQVATLSGTGISVEDMAALSFTMTNGALGSLHAGYVLRQRYGDIYLSMRGTLGEAVWQMWDFEGRGDTLKIYSEAPGWETTGLREIKAPPREAPGYGGAVGLQYVKDFILAARQGKPFVTDGQDALRAMQVVEAAYTSSAAGKEVKINA